MVKNAPPPASVVLLFCEIQHKVETEKKTHLFAIQYSIWNFIVAITYFQQ